MRLLLVVWVAVVLCGCSGREKNNPRPPSGSFIFTPETAMVGKVIKVNREARFVVVNFPIGRLPALDRRMNVYRGGLKAGEVRITGPQREDNIVADLTEGEAQPGDEVRDQ